MPYNSIKTYASVIQNSWGILCKSFWIHGAVEFRHLVEWFIDPDVVYETPRRVLAPLCGDVCACDYVFVDETAKDSHERFKELLDLDITEDDINMDCEQLPSRFISSATNSKRPLFVQFSSETSHRSQNLDEKL